MYQDLSREELIAELNKARGQIEIMKSTAFLGVDTIRTLGDQLPIGMSLCFDKSCREIRHNSVAAKFLRISNWEVASCSLPPPHSYKVFINGNQIGPEEMPVQRSIMKGDYVHNQEIDFIWNDGIKKSAVVNSKPITDAKGSIIGAIAVMEDITEKKRAVEGLQNIELTLKTYAAELEKKVEERTSELESLNERLRLNEERFRLAISGSPTLVFTQDRELRYTWILNPRPGFLSEDMLGKTDEDIFPVAYSSLLTKIKSQVFKSGVSAREEVQTLFMGKVFYYDLFIHPDLDSDGSIASITCIANDITERKKAEEDLRQSEDRFATVFYSSPAMMTVTRLSDLQHIAVNDAWLGTLGYDKEEILGRKVSEGDYLLNSQDAAKVLEAVSKGGLQTGLEINVRTKDGQFKTCLSNWQQITIDGEPCILGAAVDITERKQVEEALSQSEERFYKAFRSSPVMMGILSCEDNRYIDINDSWLAAFGRTRDEVLGRTGLELNLWFDLEDILEKRSLLTEQGSISNYEITFRGLNGETLTGLASSEIIQVNGLNCYLHTMIDITRQKKLEKELARLDRLNLVGEMAASIGHEIRNPMTSVRGFLQLLLEKEEYKADQDYFNLMIEELDRANEIISEYLRMAKDKNIDLQPGNLDSLVRSIYPIVQSDANRNEINVELDLKAPPMLSMDENEIRQLILNMTRNSIEAMSSGGTLTIGTRMDYSQIILFVSDNGHGLPDYIKEKLGTPFLTTKDRGTGLGLAVCYSIAARHGASIDCITGPGGTTFSVKFPI